MKIPNRTNRTRLFLKCGLVVSLTAVAAFSSLSRAEDFDDSLESELDAISSGVPAATPTPAPAKKGASKGPSVNAQDALSESVDGVADDEPLPDPFAGESDLQPLEASKTPPAKVKTAEKPAEKKTEKTPAKPVAKKPAPKAEPKSEPAQPRTEPLMASPSQGDSLAPASDEPNSAFEARLASIYSQHSEPVSDEKWSGLIGSRAAESYSVQAGDTLWDLSNTLFADGFYWSKLWAENPEIQNPHQISKGQAIRFIAGTEATPPEVRVVKDDTTTEKSEGTSGTATAEKNAVEPLEPDDLTVQTQAAFDKEDEIPALLEVKQEDIMDIDVETSGKFAGMKPNRAMNQAPYYQEDIEGKITQTDLESGVVIEQSEIVPRPILPPPSESRRRALSEIPKSFREFQPRRYDRTVTIQKRNGRAEKVPGAVVPGYLAFENVPEPMGTIDEVDQGDLVASIGQNVYVRGNEPLQIGARMYSITPRYDVRSRESGKIGSAVEIGGVLRIMERVEEKNNLYRAQVVYAVNPVRVGSMVLVGDPPRVRVTTTGRRLTTELTVAGGSISETRNFFGDGATVFLDTKDSGVRVGDVLSVQARRGERNTKTLAPDYTTPIGILKVFAVNGKVASAMIVLATQEVRVGDRTGAIFPQRLPDLRVEVPRVTSSATE